MSDSDENLPEEGPTRRKQLRLAGYDYSKPGAYFVTLCVQERLKLFGDVREGRVQLSDAGRLVEQAWRDIEAHPGFVVDYFVVMPNHLHGVLIIESRVDVIAASRPGLSLGEVIQRFKTFTTSRYIKGVRTLGWEAFPGRLWQRNYFEHIIRDEEALNQIRTYIERNPLEWDADPENPSRSK